MTRPRAGPAIMRIHAAFFAAIVVITATLCQGCEEDVGAGECVTTHESLENKRYASPTLEDCEEYCASVEGYVCCYFEPADGDWVAVAGDC